MGAPLVINKGDRFDRLTIIKEISPQLSGSSKVRVFRCRCICGNTTDVRLVNLRQGFTRSCGCLSKEISAKIGKSNIKHGMEKTRLYRIYRGMINRCYREKNGDYPIYGGRGIIVCKKWRENRTKFFTWALANGYDDNLELDRRNNNRGYGPKNCRWVTKKINSRNRSNNRYIKYKGEKLVLAEAVERYAHPSLNYELIRGRLNSGWSIKRALNQPLQLQDHSK